jgi:hypothetical protein
LSPRIKEFLLPHPLPATLTLVHGLGSDGNPIGHIVSSSCHRYQESALGTLLALSLQHQQESTAAQAVPDTRQMEIELQGSSNQSDLQSKIVLVKWIENMSKFYAICMKLTSNITIR